MLKLIISIIKIVYYQFNAYNCVKLSTVFLNVPRPDTYGGVGNMNLAVYCAFPQMWRVWRHTSFNLSPLRQIVTIM